MEIIMKVVSIESFQTIFAIVGITCFGMQVQKLVDYRKKK